MYNKGSHQNNAMIKKIFENIQKDQNKTEFERTEVQDRAKDLKNQLDKQRYGLNQTFDLRILENHDSTSKPNSYTQILRKRNEKRLNQTINGF